MRFNKYLLYVNFLKRWVKENNTLDIGAGDGLITNVLGIRGVDNEPSAIEAAARYGVKIDLGDAYKLTYENEEFDSALMTGTIEHLEFTDKALKEARRVIKKCLYIDIPDYELFQEKFHYHGWNSIDFTKQVEKVGFKLVEGPYHRYGKYFFKFEKI